MSSCECLVIPDYEVGSEASVLLCFNSQGICHQAVCELNVNTKSIGMNKKTSKDNVEQLKMARKRNKDSNEQNTCEHSNMGETPQEQSQR